MLLGQWTTLSSPSWSHTTWWDSRLASRFLILPGVPIAQSAQTTLTAVADEIELTLVTIRFDTIDAGGLLAVLSKYVVLTRMQAGCRNVDLCASVTRPDRFFVIQKWESPDAQRAHFDSEVMIDMARSCTGLLAAAPDIDLWDGLSAHDLA